MFLLMLLFFRTDLIMLYGICLFDFPHVSGVILLFAAGQICLRRCILRLATFLKPIGKWAFAGSCCRCRMFIADISYRVFRVLTFLVALRAFPCVCFVIFAFGVFFGQISPQLRVFRFVIFIFRGRFSCCSRNGMSHLPFGCLER